jgi:surface antigen
MNLDPPMRRFHRYLSPLIAALALLVAAPPSGLAQIYGPSVRDSATLTQSDIAIVQPLVRQGLTGKPNGTTLPWNNPQTSNSGTVTLLQAFPSSGKQCRRVKYHVVNGGKNSSGIRPADYVLTSCQLADGTWHLDSSAQPDTSRQ